MPRKVTPKQRVAARNKSQMNTLRKEVQALDKGTGRQGPRQPLLELRQSLKGKKISDSGAAALGRATSRPVRPKKGTPVKQARVKKSTGKSMLPKPAARKKK